MPSKNPRLIALVDKLTELFNMTPDFSHDELIDERIKVFNEITKEKEKERNDAK